MILSFEGGQELAFTDARRFGKIYFLDSAESDPFSCPPLSNLGPDPLLSMPTFENLIAMIRSRGSQRPVKTLLLDQSFLAGIGNWMADEILYQSAIHPGSKCGALTDKDLEALHSSIQTVTMMAVAVRHPGSFILDGLKLEKRGHRRNWWTLRRAFLL